MGEIYCIKNKINGKCYVGQTVNTFNDRYLYGKWPYYSNNRILKSAHAKYGIDAFEVLILEKDISNISELNKLETEWCKKLNSMIPNGYNIRGTGDNRKVHEESKALTSKPVICSNGEIYKSCKEASKALGIKVGHISECANNKRRVTNGYTFSFCLNAIPEIRDRLIAGNEKFPIICSNGNIYKSMCEASDKLNINISSISACVSGKRISAGDLMFARYSEGDTVLTKRSPIRTSKKVFSSDGLVFNSAKDAAKYCGISSSQMSHKILKKVSYNHIYYSYNSTFNTSEYKKGRKVRKVLRSDGVIFDNLTKAASDLGVSRTSIGEAIRERNGLCKGYIFSFMEDSRNVI